ncbi:MAG: hypothetical protein ACLFMM_04225 [Methanohalobium sp.]|uniref:hypothetical protein n=1 Tax=Methanohalobium sp. TaxID=2837493 RepID=UPI00397BAF7A
MDNIENIITTKSNFKKSVIDTLHDDNVEIVSPTYMNQKVYGEEHVCLPPKRFVETVSEVTEKTTEDMMFDKAIEAEKLNNIEITLGRINEKK